jgi:sugar O-acyltransferase (sialic acid O-acetyltransferase NeuD family)
MNHLKKIAVIGYGGFAREIACNLKKGTYNFFVNKQYINLDNIEILKPLEEIDINNYRALVAIGNPLLRKKIIESLPFEIEHYTFIDKRAILLDKDTINIGEGSIITAGTVITTNINIGKFSHLNLNTTVGHDSNLGDFLTTTPGVHISGETNIGKYAYFGCGSVVKNKINICDNVVVGMNSVVNKDITESGVYVGAPIKKIK